LFPASIVGNFDIRLEKISSLPESVFAPSSRSKVLKLDTPEGGCLPSPFAFSQWSCPFSGFEKPL